MSALQVIRATVRAPTEVTVPAAVRRAATALGVPITDGLTAARVLQLRTSGLLAPGIHPASRAQLELLAFTPERRALLDVFDQHVEQLYRADVTHVVGFGSFFNRMKADGLPPTDFDLLAVGRMPIPHTWSYSAGRRDGTTFVKQLEAFPFDANPGRGARPMYERASTTRDDQHAGMVLVDLAEVRSSRPPVPRPRTIGVL